MKAADDSSATTVEPVASAARSSHSLERASNVSRTRDTPISHAGSTLTTVGSPLEALERDEMLRTRRFAIVAAAIATVGAVGVMILPGDPTATGLVLAAVGVAYVAIAFLWIRTGDPLQFRRPSTVMGWFVPAACVTTAIPYFGVFSPACMLLVLGIYFTGLGKNSKLAYAVYVVCAGAQLVTSMLVVFHVTRDTGLVTAGSLAFRDQLIVQGLVQFVMLSTFVTARMSRRTALAAVGELERAVRVAAHREALLLEAREELERALRAGRGRFSGQTLGHYDLGTVIGRGAMGEVYEGVDPTSGHVVAVKLLSQASLGNPQHVLRFLRELRTVAGISSPYVVQVIEVGESPVPYLVMEKLEGSTLSEVLRGKRSMSPDDVAYMVDQIGQGITAAAANGIVHRDLKPQNLFRHHVAGGAPIWKVLDFGVARAVDQGDTLTSGHVVGTPTYMSPEQAAGGQVDHGSDLYALAAIVYRCLTGQPPYAGGEVAETLYRVVHTRPRRPTQLAPQLRSDVDLVLAIGMARLPGDRFRSAAEFSFALNDALRGRLAPKLRSRAEGLMRNGAWKSTPSRAATSRL